MSRLLTRRQQRAAAELGEALKAPCAVRMSSCGIIEDNVRRTSARSASLVTITMVSGYATFAKSRETCINRWFSDGKKAAFRQNPHAGTCMDPPKMPFLSQNGVVHMMSGDLGDLSSWVSGSVWESTA